MTSPDGRTGPRPIRTQARTARQQAIAEHVVANGVVTVTDLTELTGASVMTVHRDLDELARRGIVRRFHGGASAQPSTVFDSSSEYRRWVHVKEKEELATSALELIEPGMSIMLDTSSTNLFLARKIGGLELGPLTVVTNYVPAFEILRSMTDIRLIGVGGDYNPTHDAFLGMNAIEAIESLTVDIVFLSTSAMTATTTFHQEPAIVMVKRAMMASGMRRVLLMDPSKFGRTALHRLAPTSDFHHLIVNNGLDPQLVSELREQTDVVTAK